MATDITILKIIETWLPNKIPGYGFRTPGSPRSCSEFILGIIIGRFAISGLRLQNTGMTSIIVALIPVIGLLLYGCVNGQGECQ